VDVAYGRGSVLLLQGDEIPRGKGNFGGFSSPLTMHCNAFVANNVMQQQNGGDGSAQRGRSVMYDCLVITLSLFSPEQLI